MGHFHTVFPGRIACAMATETPERPVRSLAPAISADGPAQAESGARRLDSCSLLLSSGGVHRRCRSGSGPAGNRSNLGNSVVAVAYFVGWPRPEGLLAGIRAAEGAYCYYYSCYPSTPSYDT